MELHIVYRGSPERPRRFRPDWYQPYLGLLSLLGAAEQIADRQVRWWFVWDGHLPDRLRSLFDEKGMLVQLSAGSGAASLQVALDCVRHIRDPASHVLLTEDDYLYTEPALAALVSMLDVHGRTTFATLYDHPDTYSRLDRRRQYRAAETFTVDGVHWQSTDSTTMSFASDVRLLWQYSDIFRLACAGRVTRSRLLWWYLVGGYRWPLVAWVAYKDRTLLKTLMRAEVISASMKSSLKKLGLASPIPGLSTHADARFLSPGVDWASIAHTISVRSTELVGMAADELGAHFIHR